MVRLTYRARVEELTARSAPCFVHPPRSGVAYRSPLERDESSAMSSGTVVGSDIQSAENGGGGGSMYMVFPSRCSRTDVSMAAIRAGSPPVITHVRD